MSARQVDNPMENRNKELVQRLEDLKNKRADLIRDIHNSEILKEELQNNIVLVRARIAQIKDSLAFKIELRGEYAQLVDQIDQAYSSILNESENLLTHLDLTTTRITDALSTKPGKAVSQPPVQPQAVSYSAPSSRQQEPPALLMHQPNGGANGGAHHSPPVHTSKHTAMSPMYTITTPAPLGFDDCAFPVAAVKAPGSVHKTVSEIEASADATGGRPAAQRAAV